MIITPRLFILAIATGIFWLLALLSALFLVAGMVRGWMPFFWTGLAGSVLCIATRVLFSRKQAQIRAWAQTKGR